MWFVPGAAARSELTDTLLSMGHRTDGYGLLYATPSVDYAQYLDENLHRQCMASIDNLGILCIQLP